jgi:DNA-binding CsgD family transcriptional regulator
MMDVLRRCIRDRQMLVLLDNCEHLLDASAELITGLLGGCTRLTLLTTRSALSSQEAVAYALRGRGERKRASSGWPSLTRAELDVVQLISEGLGNKDVAARLFVSPRTVQAHLTHIYAKLGLTSRVQLAQEAAARHG